MPKEEKETKALELKREYRKVKQKLNDFGICRTEGEPLGDYAEWLVAQSLICNLLIIQCKADTI